MNPIATLALSTDAVRLSDALTATVSIDVLPPFTIAVPTPLLLGASRQVWQIVPQGKPVIAKLLDGQERWSQVYRLEPFPAGELPVEFAAFEVNGTAVVLPLKTVTVKSTIDATAQVRPVTDPEVLSPLPVEERSLMAPSLAVLAAVLVMIVAILWRRKPCVTAKTNEKDSLDSLEIEADSRRFTERLSKIVRETLESKHGKPFTKYVTSEIDDPAIRDLLTRCDAVRFAQTVLGDSERRELLAEARRIATESHCQTGPQS